MVKTYPCPGCLPKELHGSNAKAWFDSGHEYIDGELRPTWKCRNCGHLMLRQIKNTARKRMLQSLVRSVDLSSVIDEVKP